MPPVVLLYNVGEPPPPVAAVHGRFPAWFRRLCEPEGVDLAVYDGVQATSPPPVRDYAGIVVGGSPASVTAPEPWMEAAVETIREAARVGTPVLGVCFGHQLIAAAFGGSVTANPSGWEIATHEIELTGEGRRDPLFRGLPDAFCVQFSHADAVDPDTLSAANGVRVLARNRATAVQALAAGDAIRGVQFHPEFTAAIVRDYVRARADILPDADAALARARDAPAGQRVFANWLGAWVRRA